MSQKEQLQAKEQYRERSWTTSSERASKQEGFNAISAHRTNAASEPRL
ncbi:hypothetical protein RRSWK_02039 [Rhodopirellula sp. SWK7]|nr:hypothetical protein RRSWK_02039 [Rhodopirellula sp. SWK7]